MFQNSLVCDRDAATWRDEDTCKALVGLVEQLESLLQPASKPTWLAAYKPVAVLIKQLENLLQPSDSIQAPPHSPARRPQLW